MAVAPAVDIWEAVAARIDPAAARPCLARHVELKEFSERGGGGFAMLANTRDLVYYRLEPDEVMVLPLLDGTRTVGEIVVAYLHESGELDFGAVAELVAELREGGFLTERYVDTDAVLQRALAPGGLRRRAARFFKTLTVEWSGAERLTRWLYNHGLRALLTPAGELLATFVLVAGALAFTRTATDHREYTLAPQSVGLGLVVLLALNFVVVFVHELGHASLLVHHGRRVKGSGFRLSFGVPRFYIDSSDALMLDRGPRIAQSFAGTYFESVVTAIAALALWGAPDSWLAPTLYGFVVLNVFVVILNLVPLLELDGYWILSDVLRVSDLRPRAFAFIRHDAWAKLRTGRSFTRAELGLGLFGTLGLLFTILGIGFVGFFWFSTFGDLTAELWHAEHWGIAALILLIVFVAGPVLRAVVATMRNLASKIASLALHLRFRAQQGWRVEAVTMLDAQPAFDDLPADVRADLVRWIGLRRCSAGTAVVRQGERADAYYVVRRGLLDVIEEDATTGAERIIHRLGPGEAFGEVGVATGARGARQSAR